MLRAIRAIIRNMLERFKRKLSLKTTSVSGVDLVGPSLTLKPSFSSSRPTTLVSTEDAVAEIVGLIKPPSPVTPKWVERVNNSQSTLFNLPTELLLMIQPHLSPSSEVSLRQACSRFYYLFSRPSFYLAGDERFIFLCGTERDDPNASGTRKRLVCGHCRELHRRLAFPLGQLTKRPDERDCRQIWLCPHRSLGFDKAVRRIAARDTLRVETLNPCTKCHPLIRNRSVAETAGSSTSEASDSLLISKIGILQKPMPSGSSRVYTELFTTKELAAVLSGLDFQLCPHLRLGDPYILSKFCRACLSVDPPSDKGPPCISLANRGQRKGICRGMCYARDCKTGFMFQTRQSLLPDASGRRQVWLIIAVYRWLGPLTESAEVTSAAHPLWVDHTVDAAEMVEMRARWEVWMQGFGKRCLPDWSICQLHPDD